MDAETLVRRYAASAAQTSLVEPGWRRLALGPSAALAYHLHFGTLLCAGEPLCAPGELAGAADRVLATCRGRRLHVVFAPVGRRFADLASARGCTALKVGEAPLLELAGWSLAGRRRWPLRSALHRAANRGVQAREWRTDAACSPAAAELRRVHLLWQRARPLPPLGFVLGGDPLAPKPGRRWFVAMRGGRVEAFVAAVELLARRALAIERFVRRPDAAPGSVESATLAAIETARAEGFDALLLEVSPLAGMRDAPATELVSRTDRLHLAALGALRNAQRHGGRLYDVQGLASFKRKFAPDRWEPVYVVHEPGRLLPRMGLAAALDLLPAPSTWVDWLVRRQRLSRQVV